MIPRFSKSPDWKFLEDNFPGCSAAWDTISLELLEVQIIQYVPTAFTKEDSWRWDSLIKAWVKTWHISTLVRDAHRIYGPMWMDFLDWNPDLDEGNGLNIAA